MYERKLCGLCITKMTHTKIVKENVSNKNTGRQQYTNMKKKNPD